MIPFTCPSGKSKTPGAENRSVVIRDWGCGKGLTTKGHGEYWGVMELFCILIVVVVI